MTFEELVDFIENKMRMSHVYQPLLIKSLVEAGGDALRRYMPGWEPACADDLLGKALSEGAHHIGMHLYEALQANQWSAPVTAFLDTISRKAPMVVGTLNYDDLILRGSTTYYHGYTNRLFDYNFSQRSMEAQAG